jgi:hypothetical protein
MSTGKSSWLGPDEDRFSSAEEFAANTGLARRSSAGHDQRTCRHRFDWGDRVDSYEDSAWPYRHCWLAMRMRS